MTWNLQNLFDDINNGSEYREFVPSADGWTSEQFHGKMARLAEAIGAAVPGGPDVLLIQEIENGNCLTELNESYLKGMDYRYQALETVQGQAVTVGILSRYPLSGVLVHRYSLPESPSNRPILELRVDLEGDSVIIFNNHWKSKLGGTKETEPVRREAARDWITALLSVDEIESIPAGLRGNSLVYTENRAVMPSAESLLFYPWSLSDEPGSYCFNGRWEKIDHLFLSGGFFDGSGLEFDDFRVHKEDFLLYPDGAPRRWDSRTGEGYSDHLALILTLDKKP